MAANTQMYVAVMVAMLGAAMFGFDQGNFGNVQSFESFRREWCLGHFFFESEEFFLSFLVILKHGLEIHDC